MGPERMAILVVSSIFSVCFAFFLDIQMFEFKFEVWLHHIPLCSSLALIKLKINFFLKKSICACIPTLVWKFEKYPFALIWFCYECLRYVHLKFEYLV
jgi:hypothetical protein